ncbi:hypothetical protein NQZ79_g5382 [Umbelopsis isabellina]|nr:hypothetical protein NQZ79_g5382 [Umbelopsis isabellina]
MNEGISIIVAVFVILVAMRWLFGAPQQSGSQRQRANRPRHAVTPEMVETVRAMFPNITVPAIRASLQTTGSVEITIEQALRDGTLPMPANVTPPRSPSSGNRNNQYTSGQSSSSVMGAKQNDLVSRYGLESRVDNLESPEPPKVWESDVQKRQEMLRKRKEHMILQARRKMQESKVSAQQPADTMSHSSKAAEPAESSSKPEEFDELSVEQLNALEPSERRRNMMEAIERRKAKPTN